MIRKLSVNFYFRNLLTCGKVLLNGLCVCIPDPNYVLGDSGAKCYSKITHYFSTIPDYYLLVYLILVILGLLLSFLYYRNDNVKKFFNGFMKHIVPLFPLFKEEFLALFEKNKNFVLKFHFFFSLLDIFFFSYLGSRKPVILLIVFELKAFLVNFASFKRRFDVMDKDEIIILNHWSNDLDLKRLHRFLTLFRLLISFALVLNAIPYTANILPTSISQLKPSLYWNLLILSYIIEICADLHIIFFRNTKLGDMAGASSSTFFKGFTKYVGLIWGEEVSTQVSNVGTKIAENPTITGTAAGAAAGVAYEKSKHPIIVEIGKKEISIDDSYFVKTKQYFLDGAIHTDSHSNRMFTLLSKHFKGVVRISELCENGLLSQEKIREKFLTDPNFSRVCRENPHCFQPFGLGDHLIPSEARAANKKNMTLHGEQVAREMGLIIDYIPDDKEPHSSLITKVYGIPTSVLKAVTPINLKDLPGFDSKDPAANLPKVTESKDWFKVSSPK